MVVTKTTHESWLNLRHFEGIQKELKQMLQHPHIKNIEAKPLQLLQQQHKRIFLNNMHEVVK